MRWTRFFLALTCLGLCFASATWAQPSSPDGSLPSFQEILDRDGSFAFSDGSSVYVFQANHQFRLDPAGMSGRTIEGIWSYDSTGLILVTGRWGWMNGLSATDDYREMLLSVSYVGDPPVTSGALGVAALYPVYFQIERLSPIDATTYAARVGAPPAPEGLAPSTD